MSATWKGLVNPPPQMLELQGAVEAPKVDVDDAGDGFEDRESPVGD